MTWRTQRVREMANLLNGYPFDSTDFSAAGEVPLVRIRDILATEFETFVPEAKVPSAAIVRNDDVVIGMDGDFNVAFWKRGDAALNQRVCLLRTDGRADPRFLAYALPPHLRVINDLTYSTTVKHLSGWQVLHTKLEAPDRSEQRAIADYLDHETAQIDALVAKQEELIRHLGERRLAVITTTALTGLRGEEAGAHRVTRWGSSLAIEPWLARAPRSWDVERFKTVCVAREERNVAGAELMLSLTVKGYLLDRSTMTVQQNAADASIPRYLVARPGDLVVNPMWLIGGAIGVSDKRGAVSPDYRVFEIAKSLDPWYLHAVLRSSPYFDQYRLYARSNTTFDRRIKQNDLDNLPIPIPPIGEQRAIVAHIQEQTTRIDALIAKTKEHIALAKERRSALITAAVTGQIDVRTARKAA